MGEYDLIARVKSVFNKNNDINICKAEETGKPVCGYCSTDVNPKESRKDIAALVKIAYNGLNYRDSDIVYNAIKCVACDTYAHTECWEANDGKCPSTYCCVGTLTASYEMQFNQDLNTLSKFVLSASVAIFSISVAVYSAVAGKPYQNIVLGLLAFPNFISFVGAYYFGHAYLSTRQTLKEIAQETESENTKKIRQKSNEDQKKGLLPKNDLPRN